MSRSAGMIRGLTFAVLVGAAAPVSANGTTQRVSIGPYGVQGNGLSEGGSISGNARLVVYSSGATNLVPGDTNGVFDMFLYDRQLKTTSRVTGRHNKKDWQANGDSFEGEISQDGCVILYRSDATNLVPGDTNGETDVFVFDRASGRTTRVSLGEGDIQGNGPGGEAGLSADGRFVTFTSGASNLVPNDNNGVDDVFVRDRQAGTTTRVSVGPGGIEADGFSEGGSISADGRFVVFDSVAANLVPGDTNGGPGPFDGSDIFVRDRKTGTTTRVSVGPRGTQGNESSANPAISANGRFVAFQSNASNLVRGDTNGQMDIFVHDRTTGRTSRVSVGSRNEQSNGFSGFASISATGRFVGFQSEATNLVPGDTNGAADLFVHDRKTGTTTRVNVGPHGRQSVGDISNFFLSFSTDGRVVAFTSEANDLVPRDTNEVFDVFVHFH